MDKKRSIIIEGPDASGKSTLATKLGQQLGLYTFRAGPKPKNSEHSEMCMMYQCAWLKNTSCIWDRFTGISNTCNMPPLAENDIPMHAHYTKQAIEDAVIVICTGQDLDRHIRSIYESTEDIERMKKENKYVKNNYIRMAHDLPGVILTYDYRVKPYEALVEEIQYEISISI